jgi:hypothetical protein
MKKITVLLFAIALSSFSFAQADKSYRKTLRKLFEVSRSIETAQSAVNQMFDYFKEQRTEVDQEVWDELQDMFSEDAIRSFTERLVPVYFKYFTEKDLIALIEFYESPVGQKFAETNPLVAKESMQIGQEWGEEMAEELIEKLEKKGY